MSKFKPCCIILLAGQTVKPCTFEIMYMWGFLNFLKIIIIFPSFVEDPHERD